MRKFEQVEQVWPWRKGGVLALAFVAILTLGTTVQGAPLDCGIDWEWSNPIPQGNSLSAVLHSNGLYVAVGDNGTILTSNDGISWKIQSSGTTQDLHDIATDGSQFLVVGRSGTALVSTGIDDWIEEDLTTTSARLLGVASNGVEYVAVGSGGTIVLRDGAGEWTSRVSGTTVWLNAITWNGAAFVAVGDEGISLRSSDGTVWTAGSTTVDKDL